MFLAGDGQRRQAQLGMLVFRLATGDLFVDHTERGMLGRAAAQHGVMRECFGHLRHHGLRHAGLGQRSHAFLADHTGLRDQFGNVFDWFARRHFACWRLARLRRLDAHRWRCGVAGPRQGGSRQGQRARIGMVTARRQRQQIRLHRCEIERRPGCSFDRCVRISKDVVDWRRQRITELRRASGRSSGRACGRICECRRISAVCDR